MGLTDPCSSYSSVLLNAAVVSENSSSSRSCACRIPLSSAASSVGCRFVFGRWRKRSTALSSSPTWEFVARVGSAPNTILYQSNEHMFVCQLARPLLKSRFEDRPHVQADRAARRLTLRPRPALAILRTNPFLVLCAGHPRGCGGCRRRAADRIKPTRSVRTDLSQCGALPQHTDLFRLLHDGPGHPGQVLDLARQGWRYR